MSNKKRMIFLKSILPLSLWHSKTPVDLLIHIINACVRNHILYKLFKEGTYSNKQIIVEMLRSGRQCSACKAGNKQYCNATRRSMILWRSHGNDPCAVVGVELYNIMVHIYYVLPVSTTIEILVPKHTFNK